MSAPVAVAVRVSAARVAGADRGGVGAVGVGLVGAGVVVDAVGAGVVGVSPGSEVWRGLSRDGLVEATGRQARVVGGVGRVVGAVGAVLTGYVGALEAAGVEVLEGEAVHRVGRSRVRYAQELSVWAAANGCDATDAVVGHLRRGVAEQRSGAERVRRGVDAARAAAEAVVARLREATETVSGEDLTLAEAVEEITGPGWAQEDLLLAPFTVPAGLAMSVTDAVAEVGAVAGAVVGDSDLRRRVLTAVDGGPVEWAARAMVWGARVGCGQGVQLVDAAEDGMPGVAGEVGSDLMAGLGVVGDITGGTDVATGLLEGDLLRAATGAGAAIDITHGLVAVDHVADATRALGGATDTFGTLGDDTFDLTLHDAVVASPSGGLRDLDDDELGLVWGGSPDVERLLADRRTGSIGSLPDELRGGANEGASTGVVGRVGDGRFRLGDLVHRSPGLWHPEPPPGTGTTSSGLHVPTSYLEDLRLDDPRLDIVTGAGYDPDRQPAPWAAETSGEPYLGIVKIFANRGDSTGVVIGTSADTTTVLTNAHAVAHLDPDTRQIVEDEVVGLLFPRPGEQQYDIRGAQGRSRIAANPLWSPIGTVDARHAQDLAVVHVPVAPPSGTYVFPVPARPPRVASGEQLFVAGYPSDASRFRHQARYQARRDLVVSRGQAVILPEYASANPARPGQITYSAWTGAGMSGSPVFRASDTGPELVGVHAWGANGAEPGRRHSFSDLPSFEQLTTVSGDLGYFLDQGIAAGGPRFTLENLQWIGQVGAP
ncbi:MAG: trypsin-like serine peptidase [Dermatophilaceae bacterium]